MEVEAYGRLLMRRWSAAGGMSGDPWIGATMVARKVLGVRGEQGDLMREMRARTGLGERELRTIEADFLARIAFDLGGAAACVRAQSRVVVAELEV